MRAHSSAIADWAIRRRQAELLLKRREERGVRVDGSHIASDGPLGRPCHVVAGVAVHLPSACG